MLDVNGILINEFIFIATRHGYLKKPHRESFHHIKELLQGENSSQALLPRFPKVFYKFCLYVRFSSNGVYLHINKTSRQHAIRMADSLQNTPGTPAFSKEGPVEQMEASSVFGGSWVIHCQPLLSTWRGSWIARHGWFPGFQQIPTLRGSQKKREWPIRKLRHRHFEMCRQLAALAG